MNQNPSSGLRILLWLVMMASGIGKEGDAIIIGPASFQPWTRNRLMTDNFLPRMGNGGGSKSGRTASTSDAPAFVGNSVSIGQGHKSGPKSPARHFDKDTAFQKPQSNYKPYAIYPRYGNENFENPFQSKNNQNSPFKNLFGAEIGKPISGLSSGYSNRRPRENIADFSSVGRSPRMGQFDSGDIANHPFSSIRLTPISQISGTSAQQPPNFDNNNSPYTKNTNNFIARNHPLFTANNRAESFEHMNPFEKPISRSAFPLPDVNDPITLDLAEDEQERVLYLKKNKKLPPSRNFVESFKNGPSSNKNYFIPAGANKNLNIPPLPYLPSERRNQDQGYSDINKTPFEGNDQESNGFTIPYSTNDDGSNNVQTENSDDNDNKIKQYIPESMDESYATPVVLGTPKSLQNIQSSKYDSHLDPNKNIVPNKRDDDGDYERHPANHHEFPEEKYNNNNLDNPSFSSETSPPKSNIKDAPVSEYYEDEQMAPRDVTNDYKTPLDKFQQSATHNKNYNGIASTQLLDVNSQKTLPDNSNQHEAYYQDSEKINDNTNTYNNNNANNEEIDEGFRKGVGIIPKQGNYDVTVVTDEKITKIPQNDEEINKGQINQNTNSNKGDNPAVKRVVERTIDSAGEKVVSSETRLPTDHIGFILTDDIYDDITSDDDNRLISATDADTTPKGNRFKRPQNEARVNIINNDQRNNNFIPSSNSETFERQQYDGKHNTESLQPHSFSPETFDPNTTDPDSIKRFSKHNNGNPLTSKTGNDLPPPAVGSGYLGLPYSRIPSDISLKDVRHPSDEYIPENQDLLTQKTSKQSQEKPQQPNDNTRTPQQQIDELFRNLPDKLIHNEENAAIPTTRKYPHGNYENHKISDLDIQDGVAAINFDPKLSSEKVNGNKHIIENGELKTDVPLPNIKLEYLPSNQERKVEDKLAYFNKNDPENYENTFTAKNTQPSESTSDANGSRRRDFSDRSNKNGVSANNNYNDDIEKDDLRLGIKRKADTPTHDKESVGEKNIEKTRGVEWKREGGPGNKKTFSQETDDHQHINLDNLSEYLRETKQNDQTYSKSDDVITDKEKDSEKYERATEDFDKEAVDENGIPNFKDYTYDTFGKSGNPFLNDKQGNDQDENGAFSVNTDPISSRFDLLNAGEGSVSIRKVSNTFDDAVDADNNDDGDNAKKDLSDSSWVGKEQLSSGGADDNNVTLSEQEIPDLLQNTTNTKTVKPDSGARPSTVAEAVDDEYKTDEETQTDSPQQVYNDEVQGTETDTENGEGNADSSAPSSDKFFKPESSYEKYEFATPSDDGFSAQSAFVQSEDSSSSPSGSSVFSPPFESLFNKPRKQPETGTGSFRSLFQNINQDYLDSKNLGGKTKFHKKGGAKGFSGMFDGRDSLFDRQLGEIVEKRPSLRLFSRRK